MTFYEPKLTQYRPKRPYDPMIHRYSSRRSPLKDFLVRPPGGRTRIAAGPGRIVEENIQSFVWVYQSEVGKRKNLVAVKLGGQ